MYGFKLQIRIAVAVWNMKILAWKVTWIFERSYFCPCLDFLRFLAQRCLASAHFSLSVLFCVSLVPMAAVAETTDASAGDSVSTFLDTDCAVSTVFWLSRGMLCFFLCFSLIFFIHWRWASDLASRNFSAQASHLFPKNHPLNCSILGVGRVSHHQKVVHVQGFLCWIVNSLVPPFLQDLF